MRNKHKEKRMAQEDPGATEGLCLRSADQKGRTGRLRGWSDSDDGGQVEKPKRKKRRAVTTTLEHELEEGGHFQAHATHLGQPGTYEEEPVKVRRKQATAQPKEKKQKKGSCEKESKAEVRQRAKLPAKEEKRKDKKEKKRKKDHADYPEAYGMMGQAMLAPMMGMMRSMSYPMMPGMMMMPGGIIGAPLMGGVGHMMPGAPTMPYPLPGVPLVRPLAKARTKAEEKKRRFTEAPAPAPEPEPAEAEPVPEPVEEPEKRSASVSSSSSSSTSEAKNEGPPTAPVEATVPLPASEEHTLGEGELELGLISPEEGKEEHSPLQVPPGMESPVASQSPDPEASRLNKPSSWVEVEGETMEELQRELEVTSQTKPCASIGTQTEMEEAPEELSTSGLGDRWFLGFVDVVPMPGTKESSGSSSSDEEEKTTCRPERQLRRRSRSQSQGQGLESKPTGDAAEASSSSSSSSSSSGGSRKRQRAPSSDEEAAKATQSLAPQMPPVDPRRLRMVQDYSDVA